MGRIATEAADLSQAVARRSAKVLAKKSSSRRRLGGHWSVVSRPAKALAKSGSAHKSCDAIENLDDAVAFFILSDCADSGRTETGIEKVRTDVFKNSKLVRPTASHADLESFEILMEPGALEELQRRVQEMLDGEEVSWDEIKNQL